MDEEKYLEWGKWDQLKKASKLAFQHRKLVKEGHISYFLFPLALALVKDGLLDFIPVIGTVFGFFISVYLFIFMWGRGKWQLRIIIFIASALDLIPGVGAIPMTTAYVIWGYLKAKRQAKHSVGVLEEIELKLKNFSLKEQLERQRLLLIREAQSEFYRQMTGGFDGNRAQETRQASGESRRIETPLPSAGQSDSSVRPTPNRGGYGQAAVQGA